MNSRKRSSMLRFTIRDVLWLTLVVGLAVGWGLDRRRLEERYEALQRNQPQLQTLEEGFRKLLGGEEP